MISWSPALLYDSRATEQVLIRWFMDWIWICRSVVWILLIIHVTYRSCSRSLSSSQWYSFDNMGYIFILMLYQCRHTSPEFKMKSRLQGRVLYNCYKVMGQSSNLVNTLCMSHASHFYCFCRTYYGLFVLIHFCRNSVSDDSNNAPL